METLAIEKVRDYLKGCGLALPSPVFIKKTVHVDQKEVKELLV